MIDDLLQELTEFEIEEEEDNSPLAPFFAEGIITDVVRTEKSGKEGTVYCCRADPSTGYDLVAAKVYRPRSRRSFKNDAVYHEGRVILNKRDARAVARKTDWGRETKFGSWIAHEFETLTQLHALGSDVPKPLRKAASAILMEYVGDEEAAASKLREVELEPEEVRPLFNRMMQNIEVWLANDLVHGDLSAYNVLYWDGSITVIDFPQAIDPRANPNAFDLLRRDIDNICHYWSGYGVRSDPTRIAQHLWNRFLRSEL
ncbi:MAG TPA: RIO1 family regulatory kinase/ATPase [Chloroflexota bacterium]